jgi:hypothetical protein
MVDGRRVGFLVDGIAVGNLVGDLVGLIEGKRELGAEDCPITMTIMHDAYKTKKY